jgi:Fe-S-cluster containining protein
MELGETLALSDIFQMSLVLHLHALPIDAKADWARKWWAARKSRIPLPPALDEAHRHLSRLATRRIADKPRQCQFYLQISAVVDRRDHGGCPALRAKLCGIYERRPLTCRTVPLHYSRAPSTLRDYLDTFIATDAYECDRSDSAPILLNGNKVVDTPLRDLREAALDMAKSDRAWKDGIVRCMEDPRDAESLELPNMAQALSGLKQGYSLKTPIVAAWRVARRMGALSTEDFVGHCRKQMDVIARNIAEGAVAAQDPQVVAAVRMARKAIDLRS